MDQRKEKTKGKKKKAEVWGHSKGRNILLKMLEDGELPLEEADDEEVDDSLFYFHSEFSKWAQEDWKRRLKACRGITERKLKRVKRDAERFTNFQQKNPPKTHNDFGRINWRGSKAEATFQEDMENGVNKEYATPAEFRDSKKEYQEFSKDRFRDRIYQHERVRKFNNYVDYMREKKKEQLE